MLRFLLLLALLVPLAPARAYWEYGHETIARIAYANVRPATRTAIRRVLADQALLGSPECPARDVAEASYWADCVKPLKDAAGVSRFGYAFSWHYQNVDVCKPFDLGTACKDGNCVSAQIDRQAATLRAPGASRADRVKALAFLLHFAGDLHQPLHAGDKGDLGGNNIAAAYGIYAPRRFNIHSVWDGPLAERAITSGASLVRRYPAATRTRLGAGDTAAWSRENWAVSRDFVYASALGGDPCGPSPARTQLDDTTIARLAPVLRQQVLKGGLRLARLLDRALG
jgi:hypothetical protein